ncbi:MAG: RecQ family ATP-dependent DNA helicase [Planctomycetes bacterium]|nr:RecQ family ATP-dependent DNA helicase [Planctomycetota bacterium]
MLRSELGVGVDLELDGASRLLALGAWRPNGELARSDLRGKTAAAITALDQFTPGAQFWFGHNVLWYDRPWFAQIAPNAALLQLPVVDTLVLSTLAFTEHPYHALCKDYKLVRASMNDPVADARLAARLLDDCLQRLRERATANATFGRVLFHLAVAAMASFGDEARRGMAMALAPLGPPSVDVDDDLRQLLAGRVCTSALPLRGTPLAKLFAFAWLLVAGRHDQPSHSVLMPWVRHQVPEVTTLLHTLRDVPCRSADCSWCRSMHEPRAHLQRWFRHDDFRARPTLPDGRGAQAAIVAAGLAERSLLALLPTGGGKSLCFQLPAIARYLRRGSLTIVVSPLQALMHDQVENLNEKTGRKFAFALTGRLTPPQRREVLDAVRSGSAGLLYVAPEQLRNLTFAKTIATREIGAFVFDEAHCLSKWGHDFRPDYLFASRFVREHCLRTKTPLPPIVCVTATAKPEVRAELLTHFRDALGQELDVFDGHAPRANLDLRIEAVAGNAKAARMIELVAAEVNRNLSGSVLVYAATRKHTEVSAATLKLAGIPAEAFHAGLEGPEKKAVQDRFLRGASRVVCATNAFGMGIDKPDIRLVVHYEIPGSLEAYVQEVGRAGRDGLPAAGVLLYDPDDTETQFRLAANSRLDLHDLKAVLRRVRGLAKPVREADEREVVCTTGELLREESLAARIDPDDRDAPTKVATAIAWLERGEFVRRDENATAVFQGRPRVANLDEARRRMAPLALPEKKSAAWLAILEQLLAAEADDGFSSDQFAGLRAVEALCPPERGERSGQIVLGTLRDMQEAGLLTRGIQMTAFLRHGIADHSGHRLAAAVTLQERLLATLRDLEPDPDATHRYQIDLPRLTQHLAADDATVTPERVRTLLDASIDRAQHAGPTAAGLRVTMHSRDFGTVQVQGGWDTIVRAAHRRHLLANVCLVEMSQQLAKARVHGKDLLVEFTLEQLLDAANADLVLRSEPSRDPTTEIEHTLLFLHHTECLVLHKGLAVFRQAMTLRVPKASEKRTYGAEDFAPLAEHQRERTVQIHAMDEFARRLCESSAAGLALLDDYFRLPAAQFLARHFPDRRTELERATSATSWHRIVGDLTAAQRAIVEAGENTSMLVLAGPGSGKTRVVVHRCAFLLRVRRVPAESILVLCFNRSAAVELKKRLRDLVGDDARGVLVLTYHGMAARLAGGLAPEADTETQFKEVMERALRRIVPTTTVTPGTERDETDPLRDRLLAGFRHILVDEYQDIDEQQYRLVSAIAGRTLDQDRKLSVLAVGDDDQNVYHWRGSNVTFLQRFEQDYGARRMLLVENFRSTHHIIDAANGVIAANRDRLKTEAAVRIDKNRARDAHGGRFAELDPHGRGRVHVVTVDDPMGQAFAARRAVQRLRELDPGFDWSNCAVLSPRHAPLHAVRELLERASIPVRVQVERDQSWSLFRRREVQQFLAASDAAGTTVQHTQLQHVLQQLRADHPRERDWTEVDATLDAWFEEHGEVALPRAALRNWFGEHLRELRRERTLGEGVLLGTVHGSKGAEYDHVVLLDGGWQLRGDNTWDDLRRLYYVGMTRARLTLTMLQLANGGAPWLPALSGPAIGRSRAAAVPTDEPATTLCYEPLSLADLWLSFAGRDSDHEHIDAAVRELATGDRLRLELRGSRLYLLDGKARRVGALSELGTNKWRIRLDAIRTVRTTAVVQRTELDEGEQYRTGLRRSSWFNVVAEVAYAAR